MFTLIALITVISVLFFILLFASQLKYQYWNKRNVPHLRPTSILGNVAQYILQKKNLGVVIHEICQKFPSAPYIGAYYGTEPTLILQDPGLIKLVMAKDFHSFTGREIVKYSYREPLTKNLFFTHGGKWKVWRQNLTPLFSSAKMKNMYYLIEKCSRVLENVLEQETKVSKVVEIRSLMARYTMDCIGSCVFGVDTNAQEHKENNPFRVIGDAIFDNGSLRAFKIMVRSIWPSIFYGLGMQLFPKDIETFFNEILNNTFQARNYKPSARRDFVDLMLKLKESNSSTKLEIQDGEQVNLEVTSGELVSQSFGIFGAGYETSATTISFTLFELAKNFKAQEKVLEEVDAYLRHNENVLKYECVSEMPYLNACIDETLRLYPVLAVITREVTEDYLLPNGLKLEKGLRVYIPVYNLHYNPNYFSEPEKFRPERFFGDEKNNIKSYTYMPFGEGLRICIGMRFSRMQMISALITLLKKYRLELAVDMNTDLEFEPRALTTQPNEGIRLELIERDGWEQRVFRTA